MSSLIQTSESNAIVYISSTIFFSHLTTIRDTGGDRSSSNTITISTTGGFAFSDGSTVKLIDTPFASITLDASGNVLHEFPFTYGGTTDAEGISIQGKTVLRGTTSVYDSMYIANSMSTTGSLDAQSLLIGSDYILTRSILTSTIESLGETYISSLYIPIDSFRSNGYMVSNDLYSTITDLGYIYLSSPSLQSTVDGLGTYYVSTGSMVSTVTGLTSVYIVRSNLISTVDGLGTLDYASKADFLSTTARFGQGYIEGCNYTSTVAGLGSSKFISNSQLSSTINGLGSLEYISSSWLVSTTVGILLVPQGNTTQLYTSTVRGLGSSTYISTPHLVSSVIGVYSSNTAILASTVDGLGTAGYISYIQLTSTVKGLSNTYATPCNLVSTVGGFFDASYRTSFTSTVAGLGDSNYYISSINPTVTSVLSNNTVELVSTFIGLGQTYLSTGGLTSTVQGLSDTYILSSNLVSTVSAYTDANTSNLVSTVNGLAELPIHPYLSSTQLFSTVSNVNLSNETAFAQVVASLSNDPYAYIPFTSLTSTVQGLSNYIVSSNLVSTVTGYTAANSSNIVSTVNGLAGLPVHPYVSSTQLFSTVSNVNLFNETTFTQVVASLSNDPYTYIQFTSLASTVQGLSNYIVSSNLVSTVTGYTAANNSNIISTVNGLAGLPVHPYISSTQLFSTVSNVNASNAAAFAQTVASLSNDPYAYIPFTSLTSTVRGLSNTYIVSSNLVSTVTGYTRVNNSNIISTVNGLAGLPVHPYISSTQLFSTVSNVNTSNAASFAQVVASLSNDPYAYIPFTSLTSTVQGLSNYIVSSNLVSTVIGYTTANTSNIVSTVNGLAALPVDPYVSSTQLFSTVSNVNASNAEVFAQVVASLSNDPYTYIPFTSLTSTVQGLSNYIVPSNLVSTVIGYTEANRSNIVSTVNGLAALPVHPYVSSTQLFSTVSNVNASNAAVFVQVVASLSNSPYTYIPYISLTSTVQGLSNTYILSSNLVSTVTGYGANTSNIVSTVNGLAALPVHPYISSTQLFSTVSNVNASNAAAFTQVIASLSNSPYTYFPFTSLTSTVQGLSNYIVSSNLVSTVSNLGTLSLLQTSNLTSTVNGLGSMGIFPYISSTQLFLTVLNVNSSNAGVYTNTLVSLSNTPYNYITLSALRSTNSGIYSIGIRQEDLTSTSTGLAQIYGSNLAVSVNGLASRIDSYAVISTTQLHSTVSNVLMINNTQFSQTMPNLGSAPYRYISSQSLVSTVIAIFNCNVVFNSIPPIIESLPPNLVSTVNGLGILQPDGYISSSQLFSTVYSLSILNGAAFTQAVGSLSDPPYNYIWLTSLVSTVQGLGYSYISSPSLIERVSQYNVNNKFTDLQLISSIANLGTKGYYSTDSFTSTLTGLGTFGYISLGSLVSTAIGLSNIYVFSNTIETTYNTIQTNTVNVLASFPSTVQGLGSLATPSGYGYISTPSNYTITPRYIGIPTYISSLYAVGNVILRSTTSGVLTNILNTYPATTQSTITIALQTNPVLYVYTPSGVVPSSNISLQSQGIQMCNVYCSCNVTSYSFNATSYSADGTMLNGSSDRRLKYDILPLTNALDSVSRLEGVSYKMIGDTRPCIGFIAQDVERVFPELVFSNSSTKSIKYDSIGVVILEAIKELNLQCDQLLSTMGE